MPDDTYMQLLNHAMVDVECAVDLLRARFIPEFALCLSATLAARSYIQQAHARAIAIRLEHGTVFPRTEPTEAPHA
jgi:hypothetical protein